MNFFCVTPCLNADAYLEETMLSVLHQTVFNRNDCSLYYVIRDGGSSDNTINVINDIKFKFKDKINIKISFISEKDNGMYDAVAKGFSNGPDCDVYSYINAGDVYSTCAFEIVEEIFSSHDVKFLTGINANYNNKGHLINFYLPFEYNKYFLNKGFYGTVLPYIQQESTFWQASIHKSIDFNKLKNLKYAGDYYLWITFINVVPLYIVSAWLGGFRRHDEQLSSVYLDEYKKEVLAISMHTTVIDYVLVNLYKLFGYLPNGLKKYLSPHTLVYNNVYHKYCLKKEQKRQ